MKTAVVTGASSGIGLEICRELLLRGWQVAMLARRVELMRQEMASSPFLEHVLVLECDVTRHASVRDAVSAARQRFGAVSLAIANAGISSSTPAASLDLHRAELILQTNFNGMLYLFAETVPEMVTGRAGRFAGVASLAGLRGLPTSSIYSASKAAMQNFLEGARVELRSSGVGVTVVNPGFVRTAMTARHRFRLPFVMDADRAARITVDGIERGSSVIDFPAPTAFAMRLARLLPAPMYDVLIAPYGRRRKDEP